MYEAIFQQRTDIIRQCLYYNWDFDRPIKSVYDGAQAKSAVFIGLEQKRFNILRLLADAGYVITYKPMLAEDQAKYGELPNALQLPEHLRVGAHYQAQNAAGQGQFEDVTNTDETRVFTEKFLAEIGSVRSLKQLCRKAARREIGFQIHKKVRRLQLPAALESYLLLEDMMLG